MDQALSKQALANIILAIALLVIVADKLLYPLIPFWGLENEDAFIYADTGRYMLYEYPWSEEPFLTKAIYDGSYTSPEETVSYATHYEGYSVLISLTHRAFGYWVYTPLMLSSLCGIIGLLFLCLFSKKHGSYDKLSLFLCFAAFATSPLARSFQSSGVSEAISSLFVLTTVLCFIRLIENDEDKTLPISHILLTVVAYTLAILIKRENLALCCLWPACLACKFSLIRNLKFVAVGFLLFLISTTLILVVPTIESMHAESSEISNSAFALSHFMDNAPRFIECMLRPDLWGLAGIMAIIALISNRKSITTPRVFIPSCMLAIYFLLYTFHFRSQYQVAHSNVTAFEMMRFSTNIFPLATLLAMNMQIPKFAHKRAVAIFAIILVTTMTAYSTQQKFRLSKIEHLERTEPVCYTLSKCTNNEVVVTDIISLARIHGSEDNDILAQNRLTEERISKKLDNGTVGFWVIHRPDEIIELVAMFENKGLSKSQYKRFHSYDVSYFSKER